MVFSFLPVGSKPGTWLRGSGHTYPSLHHSSRGSSTALESMAVVQGEMVTALGDPALGPRPHRPRIPTLSRTRARAHALWGSVSAWTLSSRVTGTRSVFTLAHDGECACLLHLQLSGPRSLVGDLTQVVCVHSSYWPWPSGCPETPHPPP